MLKRALQMSAAVAALFCLDQGVKAAAVCCLRDVPPIEVIPNLFNLAYVENRGCAWGMFQGHVWPLALFALVAMGVLIWKRTSVFPAGRWGVAAELMLYAGILGNLADRIFRGCVVDMFDFHWGVHHFPVFNVADSFITVAAAILIGAGFFAGKKKSER